MSKQAIGGVQAHSVGEFYPLITIGFGDGTHCAAYAGVESGRVASAQEAIDLAISLRGTLKDSGPDACLAALRGHAHRTLANRYAPVGKTGRKIVGGVVAFDPADDVKGADITVYSVVNSNGIVLYTSVTREALEKYLI